MDDRKVIIWVTWTGTGPRGFARECLATTCITLAIDRWTEAITGWSIR